MAEAPGVMISVIIPVYHAPALDATLAALSGQSARHLLAEIVVAGEQPAADLPAPAAGLTFIPVDHDPSPAHNRNVAVAQTESEWLAFTDADCLPVPQWLAALAAALAAGADAVGGSVALPSGMPYWGRCDHLLAFGDWLDDRSAGTHLGTAATLNFAIRRDIFLAVGGFDEKFQGAAGEDRDFCWRLRQAGYQIIFAPAASVVHCHARADLRSAWQHLFRYGQATSQFRRRRGGSRLWQAGAALAQAPALGELLILIRVIARAFLRPFHSTAARRDPACLLGMAVLDLAHGLGMLRGMRANGA